jgi:hypothetical protein
VPSALLPPSVSEEFNPAFSSGLNSQPFYHTAVFQMLFDDFKDVFRIHIPVPDIFRIHHDDGAFVATIKASRIIDPYPLGLAVQPERLHASFGIIPHSLGPMIVTADGVWFSLIYTEKYVALIIAHRNFGLGWVKPNVNYA